MWLICLAITTRILQQLVDTLYPCFDILRTFVHVRGIYLEILLYPDGRLLAYLFWETSVWTVPNQLSCIAWLYIHRVVRPVARACCVCLRFQELALGGRGWLCKELGSFQAMPLIWLIYALHFCFSWSMCFSMCFYMCFHFVKRWLSKPGLKTLTLRLTSKPRVPWRGRQWCGSLRLKSFTAVKHCEGLMFEYVWCFGKEGLSICLLKNQVVVRCCASWQTSRSLPSSCKLLPRRHTANHCQLDAKVTPFVKMI